MNKKTIIIWAFVVIGLLVTLAWIGYKNTTSALLSENSNSDKVKSQLTVSETVYDFGSISMANGKVNKSFKMSNLTSKDIIIARVVTSCMCTEAYIVTKDKESGPFGMPGHGGLVPPANVLIKAGDSLDIKVVYDPNAHGPAGVGLVDRFIDITEKDGGLTRLEIKAVVTP